MRLFLDSVGTCFWGVVQSAKTDFCSFLLSSLNESYFGLFHQACCALREKISSKAIQ
jgi:hypothetical protein